MLKNRNRSEKDDSDTAQTGGSVAMPPPPPALGSNGDLAASGAISVIAPDLEIAGDLDAEGTIQINGSVKGDISCQTLVIGETGAVDGNIKADSLRISGNVRGQVRSREVIINKTARMIGDVYHESLTVEQGALLEGHCARLESQPTEDKKREAGATMGKSEKNGSKGRNGSTEEAVATATA